MAGIPSGRVALGLGLANSGFGSAARLAADSNANLQANVFIPSYTSTATAAGTTTLTVASTQLQKFTGTTTQTVVLPDVSTIVIGHTFEFNNQSTGAVTVESSGGNVLVVLAPGAFATVNSNSQAGTTAASWDVAQYGYTSTTIPISGVSGLSANVEGTGRTGVDNQGGWFVHQNISAPAAGNGVATRSQAVFSYTGGTPGQTNTTETVFTNVSAGVADYVWGFLSVLTNGATAGQNTAGYHQALKTSTGPTFATVSDVQDQTGGADPTTGSAILGHEIDVTANGTDANLSRIGLNVVAFTYGVGAAAVIGRGLWFSNEAGASFTKGVDFASATINSAAIHMADTQKIAFDTALTRTLSYGSTRLTYSTPSAAAALVVTDAGKLGLGAAPSTTLDIISTGGTNLRLLDASTIDLRMTAQTGTGSAIVGTYSNNVLILFQNGAEALRITTGKQLQFQSSSIAANGSVATGLTSVGPTGSHTTVQEWLEVVNPGGTVRYVPLF